MSEGSDGKRQLREWSRSLNDDDHSSPALALPPLVGGRGQDVDARAGTREPTSASAASVPTIDLRRVAIPLWLLTFVPRELARDKLLLPFGLDGERLLLAVADPTERQVIEELEFTSGRHVSVYLAVHGMLRDVIEAAYAAQAAGASVYRGALAADEERADAGEPNEARLRGREPGEGKASEPGPLDRTFDDELSRPLAVMALREVRAPQGDARGSEPSPPPGAKRKVLVVDDSDDIRRLLVRVFRERYYEVIESASGLDALQKVRESAPDVLVLDAMLPEIHGFDLCRRIKGSRRYGHIPVVLVSAVYRGWRFAEDLRLSYGVDEYLEKPFRIGQVLAAVERALAGKSKLPAEEQEPEGPAADLLRAGIDAYERGDLDAAIEHLKKGLGVDPLAFRLHYHLGLLYGKRENVFEAIQALEAAADLRPRDFSTLKNLAVLYHQAGFRLQAAEMWQRAHGSAPDEQTRANIRNHIVSLL